MTAMTDRYDAPARIGKAMLYGVLGLVAASILFFDAYHMTEPAPFRMALNLAGGLFVLLFVPAFANIVFFGKIMTLSSRGVSVPCYLGERSFEWSEVERLIVSRTTWVTMVVVIGKKTHRATEDYIDRADRFVTIR